MHDEWKSSFEMLLLFWYKFWEFCKCNAMHTHSHTSYTVKHNTTCMNTKKCMSNESDFDLYSILDTASTHMHTHCNCVQICLRGWEVVTAAATAVAIASSWTGWRRETENLMAKLSPCLPKRNKTNRIQLKYIHWMFVCNVSKQFTPFNQKTNDSVIHLMFDRLQSYLVKSINRCKCIA